MFIYSNGCSISSGYEIETHYTEILADSLKSGWMNDARPSVGNDWIFHKSLESLINLKPVPDLVIIQWSSPYRRVHQCVDNKEWYVTVSDHTNLNPKLEPMASKHTLHYIYCMQEFLIKMGYPYLFIDYFGLDDSVKKLNIYNNIDWDKFLYFDRLSMIKAGFVWDDFGHPNIKGCSHIAREIIKKLNLIPINTIPEPITKII